MNFHIITVVWGRDFVEFFLQVALSSQLEAGNLPVFAGTDSVYKIYTDEHDAHIIKKSENFQKLAQVLRTEIILIDHLQGSGKYSRMTLCHKWAIHDAYYGNARVILLPPDIIFSMGSFSHLLRIARTGKPVIMMAAPRVQKEDFIPVAIEKFTDSATSTINAPARALVQLAMQCLHPVSLSNFHNTRDANLWPSQLYFNVSGSGFIAHCFHLHPLMFVPCSPDTAFEGTVDADYLLNSYQNCDDISILDDSDQFLAVELCDVAYQSHRTGSPYSLDALIKWARSNTDAHHRKFVTHPIYFRYSDNTANWTMTEDIAKTFIGTILKYVQ